MTTLKDSSEIKQAARLLQGLLGKAKATPAPPVSPVPQQARPTPPALAPTAVPPAGVVIAEPLKKPSLVTPAPSVANTRGQMLEDILSAMCKRSGFMGAVIADRSGLPLAVFNSPVGDDSVAAFTSVLGDALDRAGMLLKQKDANNISMDINYTDKVVLRRFLSAEQPFYLMVICDQAVDERSEVELSIDQVKTVLM